MCELNIWTSESIGPETVTWFTEVTFAEVTDAFPGFVFPVLTRAS